MRARTLRSWLGLVGLLASLAAGCARTAPVDALPAPRATLAAAGKRLARSHSAQDLTELGRDGARLLGVLNAQERDALARGLIRFHVSQPVTVTVAALAGSEPFWLRDQGFERTSLVLRNEQGIYTLHRKAFPAGAVGLGVNGLDRSPRAHYAVFVKPQAGDEPLKLSGLEPAWCRAVAAQNAASLYSDSASPLTGLPAELKGSTLLQTRQSERNTLSLLHGRAWKTHVPSARAADQVAIAFGADASQSLTWTWRTAAEVAETALRLAPLADGRAPPEPRAVRVVPGDSWLVHTPSVLNDPVIRRHRVSVSGLQPATRYAYSVRDGSDTGWSPWRTVTTAPAADRPVRLVYLGDAQCGFEAWGRLLARSAAIDPPPTVVLMAGDLVDRGNERSNWDHFFLRAAGVFDRVPMMPAVGNHEYLDQGPRLYSSFFRLPANGPAALTPGLAYSFTCGDALIAVLDSTLALADGASAQAQAEWLEQTLARSSAAWKLVMFHHPVYASHTSRQSPALREAWVPAFDHQAVDLVLQGHDHAYLRTYPLRGGQPHAAGTVYVVAVSGQKFYDQDPRGYTARGLTHTATYQVIDLEGTRLSYRAFDGEGREVDAFVLTKPAILAQKGGGAGSRR